MKLTMEMAKRIESLIVTGKKNKIKSAEILYNKFNAKDDDTCKACLYLLNKNNLFYNECYIEEYIKILEEKLKITNKTETNKNTKKSIKVKMEINSNIPDAYNKQYCNDDRFCQIVLSSNDKDTLFKIAEYMDYNVSETTICFDFCDEYEGKFSLVAGFDYEHGFMKQIKDDIKETFKDAKRVLNIK